MYQSKFTGKQIDNAVESVEEIKTDIEELTERTSYKYVKTFKRNSPENMEDKTWKLSFPKNIHGKLVLFLVASFWNKDSNGYIEKICNLVLDTVDRKKRQYSSLYSNKDSKCSNEFSIGEFFWDVNKWSILIKSNASSSHNSFTLNVSLENKYNIDNFNGDLELSECYSDATPSNDNDNGIAIYKTEDISTTLQNGWEIYSASYPLQISRCGDICTICGVIKNGLTNTPTILFNIPKLYRPKNKIVQTLTLQRDASSKLIGILPTGDVRIQNTHFNTNEEITINAQYII